MKVNKLTPNFEVRNIKQTVEFYVTNLGFNFIMAVPESQDGMDTVIKENVDYVWAHVQKENIEIFFQRTDSFKKDVIFSEGLQIAASVSFYMEIEGIKEFYESLKMKGLQITELKTTWYGMQEFYLKDINGYILGFAEKETAE